MKPYDVLLFDADGTLLDFKKTEYQALSQVFEQHGYTLTQEIRQVYEGINRRLWDDYEKNLITRDTVLFTRFQQLFAQVGIAGDGREFENDYRCFLNRGHDLVDGALELCKALCGQYRLYIVTNGTSETQFRRLEESGLAPWFREIFVSEAAGFQKPRKGFFDYTFGRIPNFQPETALIIGDSLTSDILGGNNAGIDTCWYNPDRVPLPEGFRVTLEIASLSELPARLEGLPCC